MSPNLLCVTASSQAFLSSLCLRQISPLRGPAEGGTLLTVQGRNLGRRPAGVHILIGDVPCDLLPERYTVSVE